MASAKAKLEKSVSGDAFPLDYSTSMRVIRDALHGVAPPPVVISEGANTMDNARCSVTPLAVIPMFPVSSCHWIWTHMSVRFVFHFSMAMWLKAMP